MIKRLLSRIIKGLLILSFLGLIFGAIAGYFGYRYFSRDLPKFEGLNSYQMEAASEIFAANGEVIAEEYEYRRYPININELPEHVKSAFLAAEDADFYNHPGIDPISILRALIINIQTGQVKQGGSTITQQVVKNLLLTNEKKLERKIKEAILAFRVENKLSKDQILELYLNQIFFGNSAYGIEAAARVYFQKPAKELTIAEAAMLGGLPQAPSRYSPSSHFSAAKRRQEYVLREMKNNNFISTAQYQQATDEKVIVKTNRPPKFRQAGYYATEVLRIFREKWPEYNLALDGLKVYTALDLNAYNIATKYLKKGIEKTDRTRGWRGPIGKLPLSIDQKKFVEKFKKSIAKKIEADKFYPALITNISKQEASLDLGYYTTKIKLTDSAWAKKLISSIDDRSRRINLSTYLSIGDIVQVKLKADAEEYTGEIVNLADQSTEVQPIAIKADIFELAQEPKLQGSLTLLNPYDGRVLAVVGGYDFKASQFNRSTQALRQPGSAFKPIVYLAAIDAFNYTASTIVYDEPRTFQVGTDVWTPDNYDKSYLGPIPLRMALEKSRNIVSADIISRIGIDPVVRYAKAMGIESPLGRNLSLSLGSSEVTPLEITRAYGVFPARGALHESVFITKIVDQHGQILYNYRDHLEENTRQVIDEKSAYVMVNLMRGVVERGTGWRVKALGRPAAGKTGTSNDQMDAWFVGYTPEYALGVWVGFDQKKMIGARATGGAVAVPIWLNFMKEFLAKDDQQKNKDIVELEQQEAEEFGFKFEPEKTKSATEFLVPDGLETYWVTPSGYLAPEGSAGSILEYYLPGTHPNNPSEGDENINYWELEE